MRITLIRHGITKGNQSGRYIGTTDEELSYEGKEELIRLSRAGMYNDITPDIIFTSPMQRCIQTKELLFGKIDSQIVSDLRECDFGDFEGKNYIELNGNKDYQMWIDSGGTLPFPNGEDTKAFKQRCVSAFEKLTKDTKACKEIALIVHGGTIMAIMEAFDSDKKNYFEYQVKNCEGFITEYDEGIISVKRKIIK